MASGKAQSSWQVSAGKVRVLAPVNDPGGSAFLDSLVIADRPFAPA